MSRDTLALILGGGPGKRLRPLTGDRAKPAVGYGGTHRVIDFPLSNFYHSDIRKICVLTQFESSSLHEHIRRGWYPKFGIGEDEYLTVEPAMQGADSGWYEGTADAVFQNRNRIRGEARNKKRFTVNVFGGDHIYFMDIAQMNRFHNKQKADLTIAAIPVTRKLAAYNYGVIEVNNKGHILSFEEKPPNPKPIPGNEEYCLTSMGNYAFAANPLLTALQEDAENAESSRDFGDDVIPAMLAQGQNLRVYDFTKNRMSNAGSNQGAYWRDIGNIEQFYTANMELTHLQPPLNMYDPLWKIHTYVRAEAAAKQIRYSSVDQATLANGVIVDGATVLKSIVGYDSKINRGANIESGILLGFNSIGRDARVQNAILDKGASIEDGQRVGFDEKEDIARGYHVDEDSGITVVPVCREF